MGRAETMSLEHSMGLVELQKEKAMSINYYGGLKQDRKCGDDIVSHV